jgi:hypothetical protein
MRTTELQESARIPDSVDEVILVDGNSSERAASPRFQHPKRLPRPLHKLPRWNPSVPEHEGAHEHGAMK